VGQPTVKVGVVDIGTNSMRLLVTDGTRDHGRWVEVTGLGRGIDRTGALSEPAIEATLQTLRRFGQQMDDGGVSVRAAIATSATRDASNREQFLDRAERALAVRPEMISAEREGRLAYAGATSDLTADTVSLVCDIGGGSTEFVESNRVTSVDIGSVRLTDRLLGQRPPSPEELARAREHVRRLFADVASVTVGEVVGVAGTWTSIAAIDLDLPAYDRDLVHHHSLPASRVTALVTKLASMTVEETASIPSLDPARAPVILSGSVVAEAAYGALGVESVLISERDTLDGLAAELLALA